MLYMKVINVKIYFRNCVHLVVIESMLPLEHSTCSKNHRKKKKIYIENLRDIYVFRSEKF